MKLREMHDLRPARLEGLDESGDFQSARHAVGRLRLLPFDEVPGMFDVVMAGERAVTGQFLEPIAVRIAPDSIERLSRITARDEIENAETLFRPGRCVEPRHEPFVADLRLADPKSGTGDKLPIIPSVPDELEVVGFVLRIKKLVRRRKHRE